MPRAKQQEETTANRAPNFGDIPDIGAGKKPPNRGKKTINLKRSEEVEPVPGKYEVLLDYDEFRETQNATFFDILLEPDRLVEKLCDRTIDALIRVQTINAARANRFLDDMVDSMTRVAHCYIAAKLIRTATPDVASTLGPFNAVTRMLEKAPLPSPLIDCIDLLGNFETSTELWQVDMLSLKVFRLLDHVTRENHPDDIAIYNDMHVHELRHQFGEEALRRIPVRLVDVASPVLIPEDLDLTDAQGMQDLADELVDDDAVGGKDEFLSRTATLAYITAGKRGSDAEVNTFAQAANITFSKTFRPGTLRPSVIKQNCAAEIARYSYTYADHLKRVWNLTTSEALSDFGSPAQLMKFNDFGTASTSPTPTLSPSSTATITLLDLQPRIVHRPSNTWKMTQSVYRDSIFWDVVSPAMKIS